MLSRSLRTVVAKRPATVGVRNYSGSKKAQSIVNADSSNSINRAYHSSALALAVLTPVAFALPASMALPADLLLGLLFPFHSHVAMNYVVTDYVPKASRGAARALVLATTVIAAAGILKLNLEGPGLTETIKSLWRKPTKETK